MHLGIPVINTTHAYVPNTITEPLDYSKGLLHGLSNHHQIQSNNTKATFLILTVMLEKSHGSLCTQTMKFYKTTLKRMTAQENEEKSSISFRDLLVFFLRFLCTTVYRNVNKPLMGGTINDIYVQHSFCRLSNSN